MSGILRSLKGALKMTPAAPREQDGLCLLEERLGHGFNDRGLLEQALCHSSYANESHGPARASNERLEFIGDAVLGLATGHLLMERYPGTREGDLSRMRAALVNDQRLAVLARGLDLGAHLLLGRGESMTGGRNKDSILADCFEAVVGAVYLDGGFPAAFEVLAPLLTPLLPEPPVLPRFSDYKTRLQELVQPLTGEFPSYRVVAETGPDHDKTFVVEVAAPGPVTATGTGKSKKAAEQDAARTALSLLEDEAAHEKAP